MSNTTGSSVSTGKEKPSVDIAAFYRDVRSLIAAQQKVGKGKRLISWGILTEKLHRLSEAYKVLNKDQIRNKYKYVRKLGKDDN